VHLGRTVSRLTPTQLADFTSRLTEIVDSMVESRDSDDDEAHGYSFTYTLVPADIG
jgi:hypothetical protein